MSFRRYYSKAKRDRANYKPVKWTARKLLKAQRRLTRWYLFKLRKGVKQVAWDLWAIMLWMITYMGAMWMLFVEFLKRG